MNLALALVACADPYSAWPEPTEVFPWVVTPETDLEPYEDVRFETGTWTPIVDAEETGLYIRKAALHRRSAPVEVLEHFEVEAPALDPAHPWLSFAGDIMRIPGFVPSPMSAVAERLDGAVRLGNLETPVSPLHPTDPAELAREFGIYAFNAPVAFTADLPFDLLQINNNHSLDLGDEGLTETARVLSEQGYRTLGLDDNLRLIDADGLSVAVLSYTWGSNVDPTGSAIDLSIVPFGRIDRPIDAAPVAADVGRARERGATHVVLMLHWGFEYEYYPDVHFLKWGRRLVEAGADVIVGHGPHTPQPVERCAVNQPDVVPGIGTCSVRTEDGQPRDAAILYSLGNFGTQLATLPLQVGIIGHVSLNPTGGVSGVGWEPVVSVRDAEGGRVMPLDGSVEGALSEESARLDRLIGASTRRTR